jgi:hypothetical protein
MIMDAGTIGVLIPVVAIVFGTSVGAVAIWTEHKRKAQLLEQLHRERMLSLDKGVEPPPVTPGLVGFMNEKPPKPPVPARAMWPKAMRNGLMLLFSGAMLYFAIDNAGGEPGAPFALIPAAIGVANLVYAAVLWSQEKNEPPKA